jgi:hypothetical protein
MAEKKTGLNWILLVLGVALMGIFIFVAAPFVENQVAGFKKLAVFIDAHDVNTDAYSYTDSELSARAGIGARSTMEYPPRGPNP